MKRVEEEGARSFAEQLPVLENADLGAILSAEQLGQVVVSPGGEWMIIAKPGLRAVQAKTFEAWARERIAAALLAGLEQDGWVRRSDGGWQLTARAVDMPPDPFL